MAWVYLLLKQFKCHIFTALLHHPKGPPLSLIGGPRSDLEGDERDDGTHVLNLSEWLWRSPGAAQSSDSALQLSKKKNCHLVSRCCFSFGFFVLSNFWQSKKLARPLHRSHFIGFYDQSASFVDKDKEVSERLRCYKSEEWLHRAALINRWRKPGRRPLNNGSH